MSKKILILVLSADFPPYDGMVKTSLSTWDSIEHENMETVYYFGKSSKQNTDKFIYLPVVESLNNMTEKTFKAFEWALQNKEFDYLCRPHSCVYVDKKELANYVEGLPNENVFATLKVSGEVNWGWGGTGFILSRDVIKKLVDNYDKVRPNLMEDQAVSFLINDLGIEYTKLNSCSIDAKNNGWLCLSYIGKSKEFTKFEDIKGLGHVMYRVKFDQQRWMDSIIMESLFKVLK